MHLYGAQIITQNKQYKTVCLLCPNNIGRKYVISIKEKTHRVPRPENSQNNALMWLLNHNS